MSLQFAAFIKNCTQTITVVLRGLLYSVLCIQTQMKYVATDSKNYKTKCILLIKLSNVYAMRM